jgi:hypothetical protein
LGTLLGAEVEGVLESIEGLLVAGAGWGFTAAAGEGFEGAGVALLEVEAGEGVAAAAFGMGFKPPNTLLVGVDLGVALIWVAAGC